MRLEMGETRWNGRGQGGVLIAFHLDLVCSAIWLQTSGKMDLVHK